MADSSLAAATGAGSTTGPVPGVSGVPQAGPLVEMTAIEKHFGSVTALAGVDFRVGQAEVVGLLGDNGAGKSTLIKTLSGAYPPSTGEIRFKGAPVHFRSTRDAIRAGIETIYQDSALVEQMSIGRNLFLGREPTRSVGPLRAIDRDMVARTTRELMNRVGITKDLDPDTPIGRLSGGERQAIAIARAMFFEADLIIMDEPTNNLGVEEADGVMRFIRDAREAGHSSVLISHNIHHVFQVVDRIVVLRHGLKVGDVERARTSVAEVEELITGRARPRA
jgi:simple sugar transport system ATP-binding protein